MNSNKKILIIDDELSILKTLELFFIAQGFGTVIIDISVNNAFSSLKKMEDLPDLIVSDQMMPEMLGTDLALKLSKNSKLKKIPIIINSGIDNVQKKAPKNAYIVGFASKIEGYKSLADQVTSYFAQSNKISV